MVARKIISIFLVFMIFLPPTQGWSQPLEDQAQFYLQKIGPGQTPSTQPGHIAQSYSTSSQIRIAAASTHLPATSPDINHCSPAARRDLRGRTTGLGSHDVRKAVWL